MNSSNLKPQLLFSIPSSPNMKQSVLENTLQFSFPNGIDISYYEERPKIYSIVFTETDSNNYYYYILLFYEKISDNINISKSSLNRNSDINASEKYYCPISIIIWSEYGNIDFFRNLLINFYKIIKFDYSYLNFPNSNNNINNKTINGKNSPKNSNSINSTIEKEKILSFQKVELLNYFNFCYELPRPPNASIFSLNLRFDKINYRFQSLLEIPTDDYCLDVLFNTLEISVIIKLFVALLFEKFIIIISNQNMPLFCICESLRYLLFPFEHSFVYIPNLPFDKNDILDSPVPYLIGINTSEISAEELINPYRIVCEVGTSTLYGNTSKLKLPLKEEMKIKSRLLLLRSKYKNNFDNIDIIKNNLNNKEIKNEEINGGDEVVDFNLSFAQNVQNIFFNIFKENLKNIKDYIKNNNFNSQKFLNSFKNEEYKLFFSVVVGTAAFEIFINSMSYLDDCPSRKFNSICRYEYEIKIKERMEQKNYYKYSFNVPKQLNNLFKINEFKEIYDEYIEISNIIDENPYINSNSSNKLKDLSKISNKSIKPKYSYLNFYGKDNFISFALDNQNNFLYKSIIKKEIIKLYKEILKVYYDEENFLERSNKLLPEIRQSITKTPIKCKKNVNPETTEGIVVAPIKSCCQIYLLIAIYLYNTIKINNKDNKLIDGLKKSNNANINPSRRKTTNDILRTSTLRNNTSFLSQFKYNTHNKFFLEHLNSDIEKAHIDNMFIFKLFLFAFHKNRKEFPRNLFYTSLGKYTLEELKKIESTKINYIDETIQFKIRKLENKTYKSHVIKMDSDIDEIDEESKQHKILKRNINRDSNIKMWKRNGNSCINLNEIKVQLNLEDNELKEDEKKNNIKKMKLNVVDSLNQSTNSKTNLVELRNIYIQRRISQKINSWNVVNLANIPLLNNNINDGSSLPKINLNLDPMLISEKICIKLYLFLSKVKIENFDEKNDNTDFLMDLAHSNEINEIKDLILNLQNISLEKLAQYPIHYYCFWLNMYNFLTVFAIIYKCEGFSNSHEWNRFMKNSYFTIGRLEISLLEIETYILRDKQISDKIYGIKKYDSQLDLPKIPKFDNIINFGISMVTNSSPSIRIYFPTNFEETLKFNMDEFFWRTIKIDLDKNELKLPKYLAWIEPDFLENFDKYKNHLPEEYRRFIEENKNKLNINVEDFYWKLSFANFKNNEINFW